ncbi:hypothetical protein RB594_003910 [Gaeumannomyces avenae]
MEENTHAQAKTRMRHVLQHCEEASASQQPPPRQDYNHPALVRLTHEYAWSDESLFLSSFFGHVGLPLEGDVTDPDVDFNDPEVKARLCESVDAFAEYLMDNFFVPPKIPNRQTTSLPKDYPHYSSTTSFVHHIIRPPHYSHHV